MSAVLSAQPLVSNRCCHPTLLYALQNKAGNPNCLCNLIPAPGSFRRQGLWAKETDVVGTLGPDPAARARKVTSAPWLTVGNTR